MSYRLAIVTSTPQVGVALGGPGGVLATLHLRQGRRHGETLVPAIEAITRLAGLGLSEVEQVVVDAGPGLFTGLRVGVATAKALGSALGIPVVPCSSLDILAHPHRGAGRTVAAVVDARRGEVFWALYQPAADGMVAVTEAAVTSREAVLGVLTDHPGVLATGDGARRYLAKRDVVDGTVEVAPEEFDHPSAAVLLELAASRPALPAEKITPTYLREADVRIGWERM
ncbi:MAG: tRNA (adenosine(37)-N6)-threonylcarbamoyltransferase complex dimerization subunit type 1 TsaB [Acidimicrobiales bacterium]|nr:tRNA (adenosine(37)-N6)-threonylcarbamoyltransferase complex dimerization subunit type 1 TsaB [Acidimicrobiales bacterium]